MVRLRKFNILNIGCFAIVYVAQTWFGSTCTAVICNVEGVYFRVLKFHLQSAGLSCNSVYYNVVFDCGMGSIPIDTLLLEMQSSLLNQATPLAVLQCRLTICYLNADT